MILIYEMKCPSLTSASWSAFFSEFYYFSYIFIFSNIFCIYFVVPSAKSILQLFVSTFTMHHFPAFCKIPFLTLYMTLWKTKNLFLRVKRVERLYKVLLMHYILFKSGQILTLTNDVRLTWMYIFISSGSSDVKTGN